MEHGPFIDDVPFIKPQCMEDNIVLICPDLAPSGASSTSSGTSKYFAARRGVKLPAVTAGTSMAYSNVGGAFEEMSTLC